MTSLLFFSTTVNPHNSTVVENLQKNLSTMCTPTPFSKQGRIPPMIHVQIPLHGRSEPKEEEKSSSAKTARKTRRASFDQKVRIYTHIHHKDLSSRTIASVWYSKDDFWAIEKEAFITAQAASLPQEERYKNHRDELSRCSRGLEYRTPEGFARRRRNKERAWDAVLDEQDRQWDTTGIIDPEEIARVYSEVSQPHIIEARILAIQDAIDVDRDAGCSSILLGVKTSDASPLLMLSRNSHSLPTLRTSACTRAA
jgi:hypothetical protein